MWFVVAFPAAVSLLTVPYCRATRVPRWGKIETVALVRCSPAVDHAAPRSATRPPADRGATT